jgi:hypothetical protein
MTPEQALAVAVLRRAHSDLRAPRREQREAAQQFFRGEGGMFPFWCEVLNLPDAGALHRSAQTWGLGTDAGPLPGTWKKESL